jgi:putative ABC transport system ATP-binding protein
MIRVEALSKTFGTGPKAQAVLRDLSLQLSPGRFVALLGRSGSGKSTLLNCLAGIETPDRGRIELFGTEITRLPDDARTRLRRDRIGIVFQFFNLLPVLDALDNVVLPAELAGRPAAESRTRARALLAELGLSGKENALPEHLSGGEQQRVALARALINEPDLLLADEPTGNLDSATGAATLALLGRIHRERSLTVIMATHSREAAATAEQVVQLRDGRLVEA